MYDAPVRTTINIEDDLLLKLKREAARSRMSLTDAVNRALRRGVEGLHPESERKPYREKVYAMGVPSVNLDKALQLAALLEDEETIRKLGLGK